MLEDYIYILLRTTSRGSTICIESQVFCKFSKCKAIQPQCQYSASTLDCKPLVPGSVPSRGSVGSMFYHCLVALPCFLSTSLQDVKMMINQPLPTHRTCCTISVCEYIHIGRHHAVVFVTSSTEGHPVLAKQMSSVCL